ncbi:hypothetical protein BH09ACT1_BH09ACT1_21910 [soil metagenome]
MPSPFRPTSAVAAIAVLGALLVGCTPSPEPVTIKSSSPAPRPTATATASPTPDAPVAARIQINGDSLDVFAANGSSIGHFAYLDDPAASAAALISVIDEAPKTTTTSISGGCELPHHLVEWGDALVLYWDVTPVDGRGLGVSSQARHIGPVSVETPGGFGVGDSASALLAGLPGASINQEYSDPGSGHTYLNYDVREGLGVSVYADSRDGPISVIHAPTAIEGDC